MRPRTILRARRTVALIQCLLNAFEARLLKEELGHDSGSIRISTVISYAVGNVADRELAQGGPWNGNGMIMERMEHIEHPVVFMHR